MSDETHEYDRRFEIFVPSPKARINMGKGNLDPATGPFGYTGISMQSNGHLFTDVNYNTLFQTGKTYCGQVGSQWLQFSNAAMTLSSTATMNMSAANKMVIASGAGQGQITALDHGLNMRTVPYNELNLHYVVDTLQTGLFEFFHGRHGRHEARFGLLKPVEQSHFFSGKNVAVSLTAKAAEPLQTEAPHTGGFLDMVSRSWDLMHGTTEDELGDPEPGRVPTLGPLINASIVKTGKPADVLAKLRFGYSGYYSRFDPYGMKDKKHFLVKLRNVLVILKRFVHVALKYGETVQSLPIIADAMKGMEAIDACVGAMWNTRKAVLDSYPALATFKTGDEGGWGEAGIADEAVSGAGARGASVADGFTDTRKASVTSEAQPDPAGWPLEVGTIYELGVAWADGDKTPAVRLSPRGDEPATMTLTVDALSSAPEAKTLALKLGEAVYTVALDPRNTANVHAFEAALAAVVPRASGSVRVGGSKVTLLGIGSVALDGGATASALAWDRPGPPASGDIVHALTINGEVVSFTLTDADRGSVDRFVAAVRLAVGDKAAVEATPSGVEILPPPAPARLADSHDTPSLLARMSVDERAYDSPLPALELAPPQLSASGETDQLVISLDGASFTVPLDPSTTLHDALLSIEQIPLLVDISGSGNGPIVLSTKTRGSARRIRVLRVLDPSRWQLSPSDDETGADLSGLTISASELVAKLGELDGVSASVSEEALVLEATQTGDGSKVQASGNLADLIFGALPKIDEIDGLPHLWELKAFPSFDGALKTLKSWNHELQKLPEDTRNLTRPLTNALTDTVAAVSSLDKAVKKGEQIFTEEGRGAPPPPEAIGLLANGGITLGSQDRIVGSGGKGILFISDGGTGSEDRARFTLTEGWVSDVQQWSKNLFKAKGRSPSQRSLGFRVLSDSVVDLTSTVSASLAAMGRAASKDPRDDDRQAGVGIGIARVLGSYAAEVAGYEKVVVSARAPGTEDDEAGATGGRVELLGQRVAIGAVSEQHELANKTPQFLTDLDSIGTSAFELDSLAGHEHLEGGTEGDVQWAKNPLEGAAWSADLRQAHPQTSHVSLHATNEIDAVVLPYRVKLTKERARIGVIVDPEERREQLEKDLPRLERDLRLATFSKEHTTKRLARLETKLQQAEDASLDIRNVLSADDLIARWEEINERICTCKLELGERTEKFAKAEEALTKARALVAEIDEKKPFPLFEMTEDKLRFGFVAGGGEWGDYAYLEMTPDGIEMYQPKSGGKPTFDLKNNAGTVTDGSAQTYVKAKDGKLELNFSSSAKSGPLQWDKSGTVKIG